MVEPGTSSLFLKRTQLCGSSMHSAGHIAASEGKQSNCDARFRCEVPGALVASPTLPKPPGMAGPFSGIAAHGAKPGTCETPGTAWPNTGSPPDPGPHS